ncbi:hypothetical protein [Meiothermus rufus]|uniref:hypothetical protein n=1 Tax=Meiothermus rufus TaxID=604332 RepID=UPI0004145D67|nr:hypothetical protein [Meiothermus rufus]
MGGIALAELMLLLLLVGLLLWAFGAGGRWPQGQSEQAQRLQAALAELWRQGEALPHLRESLKQAGRYGRALYRLLPRLAELERFLAKPGLEEDTRIRLLARHNDLKRTFQQGVEYLERLGAELLLVTEPQEPPALAELPQRIVELREVLNLPPGLT